MSSDERVIGSRKGGCEGYEEDHFDQGQGDDVELGVCFCGIRGRAGDPFFSKRSLSPHSSIVLHSCQSASAVLAATMSPQIHPNGFRISERPVAASFAHMYSFQLLSDPMQRDEGSIPSSMNLGGVEGGWVRYWDEASTVAMLEFNVVESVAQQAHVASSKEKKKKPKGTSQ